LTPVAVRSPRPFPGLLKRSTSPDIVGAVKASPPVVSHVNRAVFTSALGVAFASFASSRHRVVDHVGARPHATTASTEHTVIETFCVTTFDAYLLVVCIKGANDLCS